MTGLIKRTSNFVLSDLFQSNSDAMESLKRCYVENSFFKKTFSFLKYDISSI